MSNLTPIRTPCIGVCSTGIGDAVCRGCKRFTHEVIDWNGYSTEQSGPLMLDWTSFWQSVSPTNFV